MIHLDGVESGTDGEPNRAGSPKKVICHFVGRRQSMRLARYEAVAE